MTPCPCKRCPCRLMGRKMGDRCDWCILGYHDQGAPDKWLGRPLVCGNCRQPAAAPPHDPRTLECPATGAFGPSGAAYRAAPVATPHEKNPDARD